MSDNPTPAVAGPYQPTTAAPPSGGSVHPTPEGGGPSISSGQGLLAVIERLATNPQLNIDVFDRLLAARREEEDRENVRAFNAALAAAKGELAPVLKTREVDYPSKREGGSRTKYKYETFADVARAVDPTFSRHGLAYRFSVAQQGDNVSVTCIVSHADGCSDTTKLEGKVDPGSTGMSMVQALGSALTYLQRYSLRAAIGLAAALDDDGRGAGGTSPKITVEQANELQKLFEETGRSQPMVLRLVGVDDIVDMTVDQWSRAREVLGVAKAEQRRKNAPAGN
jgi:hypothetical protein